MDAVLRLLRGEPLDQPSRVLEVQAHPLAAWRDDFLERGRQGLKAPRADCGDATDRRLKQAEREVGELTLENEILRAAAEERGLQTPPKKRPR
jgi:transposase